MSKYDGDTTPQENRVAWSAEEKEKASTAHLLSKADAAREFRALNMAKDEKGYHLGITARPCNFSDGSESRDGYLNRVWEGTIVGPAGRMTALGCRAF